VIGTGATAVQTIQEVAKTVGHLTVFQRTPNWYAPLHNGKIGADEMRQIRANYPRSWRAAPKPPAAFSTPPTPAPLSR
jgi:cation diffusion facilitator CzcD-associated flavoprotein CzcO